MPICNRCNGSVTPDQIAVFGRTPICQGCCAEMSREELELLERGLTTLRNVKQEKDMAEKERRKIGSIDVYEVQGPEGKDFEFVINTALKGLKVELDLTVAEIREFFTGKKAKPELKVI